MSNALLIEACAVFELRGPYFSLSEMTDSGVKVLRQATDWTKVVGDKPLIDHRNANLADLFPRPRAIFDRAISQLDGLGESTPGPKLKGPGL